MYFTLHSTAAEQQAAAPSRKGVSLPNTLEAGSGYQRYLCILVVVGFGLRLVMLDRFRFHQDEALYSYWALHFLHDDPQFLTQWIDKPPLFIWLLAYWFQLFGPSEASARLLNIGISILMIPVVAGIARQAWTAAAGVVAATAFALNPFAISYSPTAFTDPLLVLAGFCSLYAAQRSRPFLTGLCLGAAIMTKQQGVFFVPLALAVLIAGNPKAKAVATAILRVGGGLALTVLPILYWDSLRWAVAPSPWDLGVRNYGALEVLSIDQWPDRGCAYRRIALVSDRQSRRVDLLGLRCCACSSVRATDRTFFAATEHSICDLTMWMGRNVLGHPRRRQSAALGSVFPADCARICHPQRMDRGQDTGARYQPVEKGRNRAVDCALAARCGAGRQRRTPDWR